MKLTNFFTIAIFFALPFWTACESEEEKAQRLEEQARQAEKQAEQLRIAREQAEQKRIEREKAEAEAREHARIEAAKNAIIKEEQQILLRLDEILESYRGIPKAEINIGNMTLIDFGNSHLPKMLEKLGDASKKSVEMAEFFTELSKALEVDGVDPENDETSNLFYQNMRDAQVKYWTIFYKMVDYYSLFKIGMITHEELEKVDEDFVKIY